MYNLYTDVRFPIFFLLFYIQSFFMLLSSETITSQRITGLYVQVKICCSAVI